MTDMAPGRRHWLVNLARSGALFRLHPQVCGVAERFTCLAVPDDVDEDGGWLPVLCHDGVQFFVGRQVHAVAELLARLFDTHQLRARHIGSVQRFRWISVRTGNGGDRQSEFLRLVLALLLKEDVKVLQVPAQPGKAF
jgi:hypothetical protein